MPPNSVTAAGAPICRQGTGVRTAVVRWLFAGSQSLKIMGMTITALAA